MPGGAPSHAHESDPTHSASCDWTLDTLRLYLLGRIEDNDRFYTQRMDSQVAAVASALEAAKAAVAKAEMAAERRFESVNEFRSTLSDQQRNLMPRAEVAVLIASLDEKIRGAQRIIEALQAERAGVKGGWALAVGAVSFVVLLITLFRTGALRP